MHWSYNNEQVKQVPGTARAPYLVGETEELNKQIKIFSVCCGSLVKNVLGSKSIKQVTFLMDKTDRTKFEPLG
jgi:hypothetical protein